MTNDLFEAMYLFYCEGYSDGYHNVSSNYSGGEDYKALVEAIEFYAETKAGKV